MKKKQLKTQLTAAIAMMLVAAIALTSATYAWFSTVKNVDVKQLDLYVKAMDSLYLSELILPGKEVATDWKTTVLKSEIAAEQSKLTGAALGKDLFPDLVNISSLFTNSGAFFTAHHDDMGLLESYAPYTYPNLAAMTAATPEYPYYSMFHLWVKSTNKGTIFLDGTPATGSLVQALTKALTDGGLSTGIPPEIVPHIADTVRVAFVPATFLTDWESTETGKDWANAVIWEPNSDKHIDYTFVPGAALTPTGKQSTMAVTSTGIHPGGPGTGAAATFATQITQDFIAGGTNAAFSSIYNPSSTAAIDRIELFNVEEDTPFKFYVYIWVEGADYGTVNAVAKNWFETYMRFGQIEDTTP